MTVDCCPWCDRPFPFDVRRDPRITSYCDYLKHWQDAGIDIEVCGGNVIYLFSTFAPVTPEEHAIDARFRGMLKWLEERSYLLFEATRYGSTS